MEKKMDRRVIGCRGWEIGGGGELEGRESKVPDNL